MDPMELLPMEDLRIMESDRIHDLPHNIDYQRVIYTAIQAHELKSRLACVEEAAERIFTRSFAAGFDTERIVSIEDLRALKEAFAPKEDKP